MRRPYIRATFSLGKTRRHSLITHESIVRRAPVPGLVVWAMIKAVAVSSRDVKSSPPSTGLQVKAALKRPANHASLD
jgi:molybdate transport system ATP-binding protein